MSRKYVAITGVHGFVGKHLAKQLHDDGFFVHGIAREKSPNSGIKQYLDAYSVCDLLDEASLAAIDFTNDASVIHLAGLASVAESFASPERYKRDNPLMTENLLETLSKQSFKGRVVIVSTGAIYDSRQPMPLNEASKTTDSSPYAMSKILTELVATRYKDKGLDVIIARPLNHIGPGQDRGFLLPDLYDQIIKAGKENRTYINIGNLSTRRDYTDVRDIVRAYELLATSATLQYPLYNVSSGNSVSGEEILGMLQQSMNSRFDVTIDKSRFRPADAQEIIGDSTRIKKELGWSPVIPIQQTVADFVAKSSKTV